MLKYETGPFKKPSGPLLAVPSKRVTPKSKFLRKIERAVRDNVAFARPHQQEVVRVMLAQARAHHAPTSYAPPKFEAPGANTWRRKYPGIFVSEELQL